MNPHAVISLFHLLAVVPFFLYVGFMRAGNPSVIYYILLGLGLLLLIYHGYKAFVRLRANSPYAWVNLIHALIIAPLLLYIGLNGRDSPRAAYELLLMTGFAAAGYHMYSLVVSMNTE
jgi:hypothetical protein